MDLTLDMCWYMPMADITARTPSNFNVTLGRGRQAQGCWAVHVGATVGTRSLQYVALQPRRPLVSAELSLDCAT